MIAIINISLQVKDAGPQLYALQINRHRITTFTHNREEPLSVILAKASEAARLLEKGE